MFISTTSPLIKCLTWDLCMIVHKKESKKRQRKYPPTTDFWLPFFRSAANCPISVNACTSCGEWNHDWWSNSSTPIVFCAHCPARRRWIYGQCTLLPHTLNCWKRGPAKIFERKKPIFSIFLEISLLDRVYQER